jgi:hypothetical protein
VGQGAADATRGARPRRSGATPTLATQTKNVRKPIEPTPSITLDAGPNRPTQPASAPVTTPSHRIQCATTPVRRTVNPYSGTTTPR